jgi:thiol-disulfide isomerase/thioredoxin
MAQQAIQMCKKHEHHNRRRFRVVLICGLIFFGRSIPAAAFQIVEQDSETIEALSWTARGDLAAGNLDKAWNEAQATERLSKEALAGRQLDSDPHLATALGAALEAQAMVLNLRNRKSEAVELLQDALHAWSGTSIAMRLQKNLNLLSLEGKPLPGLDESEWIGPNRPPPLTALHARVVLLIFWAHWCGACEVEAPILASLMRDLESKGLVVIAPTKRYGLTSDEENAAAEKEKALIERVFSQGYADIPGISVPLDPANFERFGASTTPTIVLADRQGVVRFYHPGYLSEADLRPVVERVIRIPGGEPGSDHPD